MRSLAALGLTLLIVLSSEFAAISLAVDPNWTGARWVWDSVDESQASSNDPRYVRREFDLAEVPKVATLFVTADNVYVAYVNGQKVGEDSHWNSVEALDVAKHLVKGKNCVAIVARNQGGQAGVIAALRAKLGDGESTIVATDKSWRIARQETKGWLNAGFDEAVSPVKWKDASVLGDAGIGPWNLAGAGASAASGSLGPQTATKSNITSYRPASEEHERFQLAEGFKIELVAAEPLVHNPVAIALDEQGRLYVSESHSYRFGPKGSPVQPSTNPIVRLDPGPDGKLTRTLVAEGFDDPVMGMQIRGNKLWATANNFLFQFDLQETAADGKGVGANQQTLLVDKNKAWNPFGMFVVEWGPDGLLYLSVGDHVIDIHGPTNTVTGRGRSGIVCRMEPDGSRLERLVHGLRVPYSFEFDPFGQLWLLSNGEGNPNRFLRVIEGVDYHCFTRSAADYDWLAGRHPLAPPCFELPRGAHTQLLRYYGAGFPEAFTGNLLLDNWGAHGFNGGNRSLFRYVTNDREQVVGKEAWLSCSDPHFRCSHVLVAPDGGLLIADWYGRDDESDLTGRIWKVTYSGSDKKPTVTHQLNAADWQSDDYALSGLGSPDHRIRAKALETLAARGGAAVAKLAVHAAKAPEPIGAAMALWTLTRIGSHEAKAALRSGGQHGDWRVRRLAIQLARRFDAAAAARFGEEFATDSDPAVRVAAGIAAGSPKLLLSALTHGAASDEHLRYEAAWHLARLTTDTKPWDELLGSSRDELRLAGYIALDIALYEGFENSKAAAQQTLVALLADSKRTDFEFPLTLAHMNRDAALTEDLEKLLARADVSPAVTARAILLLRAISSANKTPFSPAIVKRFLDGVDTGGVKIASDTEILTHLELLDTEGPSDRAIGYLAKYAGAASANVRAASLDRLRKLGTKANVAADSLWGRLFSGGKPTLEDRLQMIGTLVEIESQPALKNWQRLLADKDAAIRADAVRSWRTFKGNDDGINLLKSSVAALKEQDETVADDVAFVLQRLATNATAPAPLSAAAKEALASSMLALLADATKLPAADQQTFARLGRRVFERSGCTKCHTTATADTPLAPSLRNVGQGLKHEGLVEAVLFPSKVIKTGFLPELIVTSDGKTLTGLVRDEGTTLRVLNSDKEVVVKKTDIEQREVQRLSIMPEGQEQMMSRAEFRDLLIYLLSLK